MTIGCLPSIGGGLQDLAETGQLSRLTDYYFSHYLKYFDKIVFYSYYNELINKYNICSKISNHMTVIPRKGLFVLKSYALSLAFEQASSLRQCDVIRVYQATGALPAAIAKIIYNVPFLTTYGYRYAELAKVVGLMKWKVYLYQLLEHIAFKYSDGIIVTTNLIKDYVKKYVSIEKIHYIPNGVDTRLFKPKNVSIKNVIPVIVFFGRLEKEKDLSTLLRSIFKVRKEGFPVCLKLIGDGSYKSILINQANSMKLEVDWMGVVQYHQLPEILNNADAFVLPSLREGNPKSLIEAMSCALPCIVSDCEGNRALVRNGITGLTFPVGNSEKLADNILKIFKRPRLARKLGQNARKFIIRNYDINNLLEKETELLFSIANRN